MSKSDWVTFGPALFNLILTIVLFVVQFRHEKNDKKQNDKEHVELNKKTELYRSMQLKEWDNLQKEVRDISLNLSISWMIMNNQSHENIQFNLEQTRREAKEFYQKNNSKQNIDKNIDINQAENEFLLLKGR